VPTLQTAERILADIAALVDGTLLLELWEDLVLPPDVRADWQTVVDVAWSAE